MLLMGVFLDTLYSFIDFYLFYPFSSLYNLGVFEVSGILVDL